MQLYKRPNVIVSRYSPFKSITEVLQRPWTPILKLPTHIVSCGYKSGQRKKHISENSVQRRFANYNALETFYSVRMLHFEVFSAIHV